MAINSKEWSDTQDEQWAGTVIGEARNYMRKLIGDPGATVMHEYAPMRDYWEITAYTLIGGKKHRIDSILELQLDVAEGSEWKIPLSEKARLRMAEEVTKDLIWNIDKLVTGHNEVLRGV